MYTRRNKPSAYQIWLATISREESTHAVVTSPLHAGRNTHHARGGRGNLQNPTRSARAFAISHRRVKVSHLKVSPVLAVQERPEHLMHALRVLRQQAPRQVREALVHDRVLLVQLEPESLESRECAVSPIAACVRGGVMEVRHTYGEQEDTHLQPKLYLALHPR